MNPYLQGDTLRFTISCLAPKAGNPQKSDQIKPDLGELALLTHFEELARVIEDLYHKPMEIQLLTEGKYIQILDQYDPHVIRDYNEGIQHLSRDIVQNKRVRLRDWVDAVATLPGWDKAYAKELHDLQTAYSNNPLSIEDEFLKIFPTTYMTIHPAHADVSSVYSMRRGEGRQTHMEAATQATLRLMAFNRAKAQLHERDALYPDYIYGTLTPGTGKFAFYAIGPWNERYPNHGLGILDTKTGKVSVRQRRMIEEDSNSTNLRLVS